MANAKNTKPSTSKSAPATKTAAPASSKKPAAKK